ncbi:MAG: xanthine dehydrogenase family protein molybdopterin-binding subunit [Gammaproteobacteria bacterium]|nr:xanthine dehydrogenase family protein molybdopterin-binding subunit [Gammaproteobacteria bacterium]
MPEFKLTRRAFLIQSAVVGGGLLVGFHLPAERSLQAAEPATIASGAQPVEVNAWIIIQPDDSVLIRVARSEMGQGIFTALPMLVAEELGCDWNRVQAEYVTADTNLRRNNVFESMSTGGSRSIRGSQEYLRTAGAVARELLVGAAARRWGVPAGECRAENSLITHTPSGRTLGFGAVAAEAASLPPPETVFLKDPDEWQLLGKPVRRLDVPDKIAGKPVFGTDVEIPGMLHAAIHACPVFGGRLKGFDAAAVEKRPGVVKVVGLDDAVAVVAESWWQAQQALLALPVTWDEAGNGQVDDAAIRSNLEAGLDVDDAVVVAEHGKPVAAFQAADRQVEATFYAPYLAHATMEPMTCTAALYPDGRVEVWVPTQNATASLEAAARTAGVDPLKVEVHNTQLGGGFGRRGANQDFTIQAVQIARAVGRPVKLMWSREEDMQHDFYRPASMARLKATLNAEGRLTGMTVRVSAPSILTSLGMKQDDGHDPIALAGFADTFYAIPSLRADYAARRLHVPVGFWRSVNHSQNAYFREHFLDQVAHAAGQDPYRFRLALLGEAPRQRAVLEAAAEHAGWGKPLPAKTWRGIAVETAFGSHCAQVVELRLEDDKRFRLLRVVCAIDSGHVVNPDTIAAQVESGITYGLTAALFGEITIGRGRVEQGNFDDYPMLTLRDMPVVETHLVPSGDFWGGVGEPPLPPIAPALCNALYAATGKPIQSLPLSAHGLRPA